MKVYLASEGSYSDYTVFAVFSTREAAEKVSVNEVKEMDLYDEVPEKQSGWVMEALPYTDVWHTRFEEHYPWQAWLPLGDRPHVDVWSYGRGGRAICVSGKDKATVEKAFYDRVAQMKAEDAGIA